VRNSGRLPDALHYPLFLRLWAGSIVSSFGTQMNNVAKVWVLYQLTHSAASLGIDGLCFSVPIAVLPLAAGPVVDRCDRTRVVKAAMVVEIAEAAALTTLSATGGLSPWMIYLAAAVAAARLSFAIPAGSALVPTLIPDGALQSAQSLSATVWSASALVGPALGGLLLADVNAATVFAINGISTLVALVALRPVTSHSLRRVAASDGDYGGMGSGLRYLRGHRDLVALLVLVLVTSTLLIGTETLLPVLDVQIWHGGTAGYGLLRTAPGVAAVAVGLALSTSRAIADPYRVVGLGIVIAAGGIVAFVQVPTLVIGLALLTLASAGLCLVQILVATRLQRDTPDRLRGAVGGITAISQNGLAGMAAAGMAVAAAGFGARTTLIVTAVALSPFGIACSGYARRRSTGLSSVREAAH
jgi:MFS family permease